MRIPMALALAAAFLAGPPAAGADAQPGFRDCDGYRAPSGTDDGIGQRPTDVYGLAPGDRNSGPDAEGRIGDEGVAACTAALADPRLLPAYRVRKASLLNARAAYQLLRREPQAALADLDASDAAGAGADIWYKRSIGLTGHFLRAYALILSGDRKSGLALATRVAEERPYDPYVGLAAAVLRAKAGEDWESSIEAVRATARLNPAFVTRLFDMALLEGRFVDMIALRTQIAPTLPDMYGMNAAEREIRIRGANVAEDSRLDGATAYALAATGRDAEAAALIAVARARIASIAPPGPRPDGRPPSRRALGMYEMDRAEAAKAQAAIDHWAGMISLRERLGRRAAPNAVDELDALRPSADGAAMDLIQAIGRALPALKPRIDGFIAILEEARRRLRATAGTVDLRRLYEFLPVAERPDIIPSYGSGSLERFQSDPNGFSTKRPTFTGVTTIKYASLESPLAVADELALLRAADLARHAGKRGFIVIRRRAVQRSVMRAGLMSAPRAHPEGHTVELDVLFVDPGALPPEFAAAPWRVVDAEDVWARLSGLYVKAGDPH